MITGKKLRGLLMQLPCSCTDDRRCQACSAMYAVLAEYAIDNLYFDSIKIPKPNPVPKLKIAESFSAKKERKPPHYKPGRKQNLRDSAFITMIASRYLARELQVPPNHLLYSKKKLRARAEELGINWGEIMQKATTFAKQELAKKKAQAAPMTA